MTHVEKHISPARECIHTRLKWKFHVTVCPLTMCSTLNVWKWMLQCPHGSRPADWKHYTYHDFLPFSVHEDSRGKWDREGRKASDGAVTLASGALSHRRLSEKLCLETVPPKGREAGVFIYPLTFLHVKVAPKPLISQYFQAATKWGPSSYGQRTPLSREMQETLGCMEIIFRWPLGGSGVYRLKSSCKT